MREEQRAAAKPLVGTTVGDAYRIVRLIGEGAMGGIYEARQLRLDKRVAIKVLARELAVNGEALLRFHREAEISSQLGHPHIITVFDYGTTDSGQPYLVMEFLEGEDLASRLQRVTTLSLAAAVRITKQVASALSETHAKGIVHRDLKPANLFLSRIQGGDFAKVLDFGISKVRAASTSLTNASTLMGTPMYMAPEQAKGELELDHWTDQWALACITYEMLAGRPPFVGDDTAALLYQVVHEDPQPLSKLVSNLPAEVDQVIRRALTKDPDARYPHVTAFARALEAAASGAPLPDEPVNGAVAARVSATQLTPVETAATLASPADAFAPAPRSRTRRAGRLAIVGAVLIAAVAVGLVRGPLRRRPPAASVTAAPAVSPSQPVQPVQPVIDPLPPEPAAAAAGTEKPAPGAESDEPAAAEDDTDSTPPKATMTKKDGFRRRPVRRAAGAKRAAAPAETPAQTAPVKRKLINQL
jgi:tRNA A-37 threonylcarbamoyl transferase component Bud32